MFRTFGGIFCFCLVAVCTNEPGASFAFPLIAFFHLGFGKGGRDASALLHFAQNT